VSSAATKSSPSPYKFIMQHPLGERFYSLTKAPQTAI